MHPSKQPVRVVFGILVYVLFAEHVGEMCVYTVWIIGANARTSYLVPYCIGFVDIVRRVGHAIRLHIAIALRLKILD